MASGMEILVKSLGFDTNAIKENVLTFQQNVAKIAASLDELRTGQLAIRQEQAIQRGLIIKLMEQFKDGSDRTSRANRARQETAGTADNDGDRVGDANGQPATGL